MHSVRSEARQLAWKGEGGGQYNPFGRFTGRASQSDPEKGGGSISEGGAVAAAFGAPANAHLHKSLDTDNIAHAESPEEASPTSQTAVDSNGSDQTQTSRRPLSNRANSRANSTAPSQSRQRRMVHFFGKDKDEDSDMTRTQTRESRRGKQKFTLMSQLRAIFGSYVNILLICVPIGIALNYTKVNRIAVFVVNFLAIIPLAGILSYSTEEISMRVGETLGGLLNASFGNAVELIVSIIALVKDEIVIVKTSLIGSMLSNLLLVMGMCFFFGGLKREEQHFNVTVAQTASSLLTLAVGGLIIPTIFHDWGTAGTPELRESRIPELSHGVAIIMLLVYGCYLFFQLKTHVSMYNAPSEKVPMRKSSKIEQGSVHRGIAAIGAGSAAQAGGALFSKENNVFQPNANRDHEEEEEEEETPKLSLIGAIAALCISTALTGVTAEYMVDSISALTASGTVSPEFIGLILIPIVGNVCEHATALTVAIKDKMDLAIGVAIGSSLQIALLVLPFIVVLGWIIDKPTMTLEFDGFLIGMLFIAIILVNYLIQDGKSHWLEGVLLMATYIIIAVAAWFYPQSPDVIG